VSQEVDDADLTCFAVIAHGFLSELVLGCVLDETLANEDIHFVQRQNPPPAQEVAPHDDAKINEGEQRVDHK